MPRVNGYSPGSPNWVAGIHPLRSAAVYNGLRSMVIGGSTLRLLEDLRRHLVGAARPRRHVVQRLRQDRLRTRSFPYPLLQRPVYRCAGPLGEALAAPQGQSSARLQIRAMSVERFDQGRDPLAFRG